VVTTILNIFDREDGGFTSTDGQLSGLGEKSDNDDTESSVLETPPNSIMSSSGRSEYDKSEPWRSGTLVISFISVITFLL